MLAFLSRRLVRCDTVNGHLPFPSARAGVRRFASPGAGAPPPPPPTPPVSGTSGGGAGGDGPAPRGPQPWWLLALQIGAGAVAAAGVVAAVLPSAVSTQWGLQHAMELINTRMPGRVEVAEARLGWLGPNELQCVKVYDSPRGGQILMHLNKVSTSASLWTLVAGNGAFNVIISKPWINTVYDARLSDFKLIRFLEKVGWLSESEPAAPEPSSPQLQRVLRRHQHPQPGSPRQGAPAEPTQSAAAAAAVAAGPVQQQQSGSEGQQTAEASESEGRQKPAAPKPQPQSQQKQPPQPGQQQQPGRLVEMLGRINSKMDINADVRVGRANVVVTDGMLLVPEEIRQILGPKVHITGAVGDRELREWAEEVGEDVSWASRSPTSPPADRMPPGSESTQPSPPPPSPPPPSPPPPSAVLQQPQSYQPGILQVFSDHLTGEMRMWKAGSHTLLHQPATARLALTPALSRFGLGTANPLLANVVEVRGGERLEVSGYPAGGRLPFQEATVEMAPAVLSLGPASMAVQLLDELGLKTLTDALSRPTRAGSAATATAAATTGTAATVTSTAAAAPPGSSLTASLSRMRVTFSRSGLLHTDRVDMCLRRSNAAVPGGPAAAGGCPETGGVRLALWGGADLQTDRLDFTLGVDPGPLLEAVGLGAAGLPEGYLLLMPLRGSASAPGYDVRTALLRLGQLGARQKAAQWVERQERRRGAGEGARGLVGGLEAVINAVKPPAEVVAAVDRSIQEDLEQIPPAPPPAGPA